MKKVAIVGAGGGMGLALIRACQAAGDISVITVVRNESKLPEEVRKEVTAIVEGNATEALTVAATLSHTPDVVIIAVGQKNTKEPQTLRTDVTRAYVNGLRDNAAKLVVVSSIGAADSGMQTNWFLRTFILGKILKHPLDDHTTQEEVVKEGLDEERWLVVRPTGLNDNATKNQYEVKEEGKLRSGKISRNDVAKFIVKQVKGEEVQYWGKMVAVTW